MGDHHNHGHGSCHSEHEGGEHTDDEKGVLYSLYRKIIIDNVNCLNESVINSGKTVFKPYEDRLSRDKFVESDADPELLFNIPFAGNVTIKKVIIIGGENETHPRTMRLFVNKPQMTFDNTSVKPDKELELSRDEQGSVEYPMPMTKFSSVYHLSIHFSNNFGSAQDKTKIYYIGLAGQFIGHRKEQGVVICTYEARPVPQDHKAEIPTGHQFQIS